MSIKTHLLRYVKGISPRSDTEGSAWRERPTSPVTILADWVDADIPFINRKARTKEGNEKVKLRENMLYFFNNHLKTQFLFLFRSPDFKVEKAGDTKLDLVKHILDILLRAPVFLIFEVISRIIEAVELAAQLLIAIALLPLFLCMKAMLSMLHYIWGPFNADNTENTANTENTGNTGNTGNTNQDSAWAMVPYGFTVSLILLFVFISLFLKFAFHSVWRITFLVIRTLHQFFEYTLRPHVLIQDIKDNDRMPSTAKGILAVLSVVIALVLTFVALTAYGVMPFMPAALTVMPLPLLASALIGIVVCYVTLFGIASLIHGAYTYVNEVLMPISNVFDLASYSPFLDLCCGYVSVNIINECKDVDKLTSVLEEVVDDTGISSTRMALEE